MMDTITIVGDARYLHYKGFGRFMARAFSWSTQNDPKVCGCSRCKRYIKKFIALSGTNAVYK